jgi:hypothetical protein
MWLSRGNAELAPLRVKSLLHITVVKPQTKLIPFESNANH